MSNHSSQSLPLKSPGASKALSRTSSQQSQQLEQPGVPKNVVNQVSKAQKMQVKKGIRFGGGLLRCAGCAAMPLSTMGPSTMGP